MTQLSFELDDVRRPGPRSITIDVRGRPVPQGSIRIFPNGGAGYPPAVYEWRGQVQQAVAEAMGGHEPFRGAVDLRIGFDLPRPTGHFGTGRNAGVTKPSAPAWPIVAPDLDKLVRCIGDAITDAGLWKDDAQVVSLTAAKRYVSVCPGVRITINELEAP